MSVSSPARPVKIFLSYAIDSSEDRVLFEQLTSHLSNLRYQYPSHEWYDSELSAGSPITQFIEARLNTADLIVLLISADFFASKRCYELEMKQAIARSHAGVARLIPVLLRPTDWKTSPLGQYKPLPSDGIPVRSCPDLDVALLEVVQGIRQMVEELAIQATTRVPSLYQHISIYNPPHTYDDFFTDRDPILDKISSFFASIRTRRTPILALSGLGGIGKTSIAQEYSYRSSDQYQAILWLNASSRSVLSAYVSSLADQLCLSDKDREDDLQLFAAFKQWLQDQSNWLLVLDQIEQMALIDLIVPLDSDRAILQIHRVVQDVLTAMLTTVQHRHWARQAVRLVNRVFPDVRFDTWTDCERYLPQAQHCASLISKFQLTLKEGALLLERLGTYCSRRASYAEAEIYLTQALHLYENHLRIDSLDAAQTLNSLGLLYYQQAQYQEALEYHQRALKLREQAVGPDHPKTAESLHNLTMVYGDLGEYQRAAHLYLRVLSLEERAKGPDHPDVASTLNNLGLMYYHQELYFEAETAYRRALAIYKASLTADHPNLIYPLDGLGALAEKQGQYRQAENYYQRALSICKQMFGEMHPETAHSLNKLADIAEAQGDDQHADELYQQALVIGEQVLRPGHPDIALFLSNQAFLANKRGRHQQAEPLYRRALSLYEQALGSEHPDVVRVREKYIILLDHINRDK